MDLVKALAGSSLHVVVIAASAGGLKALTGVLSGLPAGFPAAVVVVQHLAPSRPSVMAEILTRMTGLRVKQARTGDPLVPGSVFVAPPDHHLLVSSDGTLSLTESKLVHFVRPSADLLFESAAASFGERCIAVVLTGTGVDGSEGVRAVKKAGGTVIAQDEVTAEFFGMPGAAIATGCADETLPLHEIAPALVRLVPAG